MDDKPLDADVELQRAQDRALRAAHRSRQQRAEGGVSTVLRVISYGSLLALWAFAAQAMGAILPGPLETWSFIVREFERGTLLLHLGITTQRVVLAFTIAMLSGVALGALMGLSKRADDLLQGWLITALTVPRILLFVVAYLLLGLSDRALIIALTITIVPTIVVTIREGTRAIDSSLVEMAHAFRRDRVAVWLKVIYPQLTPYVIGTARGSLALSWKMVVLGELLGRTSGVGYQISFYFQFFNMRGILAYGVTMMVLLAIIDLGLMGALQRRAFRWRAPVKVGSVG
jgi:NitT/TauT family transport system permease protein